MPDLEDDIIETFDENGEVVKFKLFDVIEYENEDYAILIPIDDDSYDDEPEMVLMHLLQEGDEYTLESIDDEEKFEKIVEYIDSLEDEE